jgi:PAS domain S-box-containing protein
VVPEHREKVEADRRRLLAGTEIRSEYQIRRNDGSTRWVKNHANPIRNSAGEVHMFAGVAEDITEAQQAKEVLRQSEEKFRRILASVPDVTWTSDQYGRTVYISPKVEDVFGYTSQEIYESHGGLWPARLHPDDAGRVIPAYRALFEIRSPFDEEYRLRRKDGTWIWVHDRAIRTHEENALERILRLAIAFDDLKIKRLKDPQALSKLQYDSRFDPQLVEALGASNRMRATWNSKLCGSRSWRRG